MHQALQGAPPTPENTPGQGGFLGKERYFPKECSGSVLPLFHVPGLWDHGSIARQNPTARQAAQSHQDLP